MCLKEEGEENEELEEKPEDPIANLQNWAIKNLPIDKNRIVQPPKYLDIKYVENSVTQARHYTVQCEFYGFKVTGTGPSKELARVVAAQTMLSALKNELKNNPQLSADKMAATIKTFDEITKQQIPESEMNIVQQLKDGKNPDLVVLAAKQEVHNTTKQQEELLKRLNDIVQLLKLALPAWLYRDKMGLSGQKVFTATCRVALDGESPYASNQLEIASAEGPSKKDAKCTASEKMIAQLYEKLGSTINNAMAEREGGSNKDLEAPDTKKMKFDGVTSDASAMAT